MTMCSLVCMNCLMNSQFQNCLLFMLSILLVVTALIITLEVDCIAMDMGSHCMCHLMMTSSMCYLHSLGLKTIKCFESKEKLNRFEWHLRDPKQCWNVSSTVTVLLTWKYYVFGYWPHDQLSCLASSYVKVIVAKIADTRFGWRISIVVIW